MSFTAIEWARQLTFSPGYACTKLVLLMIAHRYDDKQRRTYPKIETLAADCSLSVRQVHRHLRLLEKSGLVQVQATRRWNGKQAASSYYLPHVQTLLDAAKQAKDATSEAAEPGDVDDTPHGITVSKQAIQDDAPDTLPSDVRDTPEAGQGDVDDTSRVTSTSHPELKGELTGLRELKGRELTGAPAAPSPALSLALENAMDIGGAPTTKRSSRQQMLERTSAEFEELRRQANEAGKIALAKYGPNAAAAAQQEAAG